MPKKSIRSEILAKRRNLAAEMCLHRSLLVQQRLIETPEFQKSTAVALYSPVRNEVFTELVFQQALAMGKLVVYPRVNGCQMEFVQVMDASELIPGAFGVLEPRGERKVPAADLDMIITPGVAFDRSGHRLGYGKGFYDRVLHGIRRPGVLAGLCFELQLVDKLPAEEHDVRMDMVITERFRYDFTGPGLPGQQDV